VIGKRVDNESAVRATRLKRLAERIDGLAEKDEATLRHAAEISALRSAAAAELYGICAEFVAALNRLLSRGEVVLDPPRYGEGDFREEAANLIQMNIRGRILQVEFEATPELISTEDFRIPYTLEGRIRAFNQELLDKDLIEEQLIFCTLERPHHLWRFFDARTYRSGPLDQEYLVSLMEHLV
jgi:hypothetical protein